MYHIPVRGGRKKRMSMYATTKIQHRLHETPIFYSVPSTKLPLSPWRLPRANGSLSPKPQIGRPEQRGGKNDFSAGKSSSTRNSPLSGVPPRGYKCDFKIDQHSRGFLKRDCGNLSRFLGTPGLGKTSAPIWEKWLTLFRIFSGINSNCCVDSNRTAIRISTK